MKLLIVDDSMIIRNKIERAVQGQPVRVVGQAKDGLQAIELCRKEKPDLMTLDITMPHMDGLTALDHLLEAHPPTRILIISALADKATALDAMIRGAAGFLLKPFSDDELNEALVELCEDAA